MSVLPNCANCGTALNGPYCWNCGQKASDLHRPIWWMLGEFLDAIFSYDSRTFRTLWLLFSEPGEFTRRYLTGQRASLLPPFRLFVIASLVFFLTLQITGLAIVSFEERVISLKDMPAEAIEAIRQSSGAKLKFETDKELRYIDVVFFVPARSIQHLKLSKDQKDAVAQVQTKISADAKPTDKDEAEIVNWIKLKSDQMYKGYERAIADPIKLNGPINVWLPRLMLILVPVFALLLAVMHWWPRVYLIEHLVFSVHIHTVLFVALSIVAVAASLIGDSDFMWAVWLLLSIYLWMAMYRVYGRSWWLTSLKFLVLLFVYSIVLSIGLGTVFLIALTEV